MIHKILEGYTHTDRKIIASGVIGNLLENFDVMICAFLAQFIAKTFLPQDSLQNNLIYTFGIFFVAYLSRPLGSLFIGLYADQIGRKKILVFSIVMVGICTAIIGLIPSYESVGIISTILFSFFRILQNISIGGEYISSIAYLIESAEHKKRGFFGSWVSVGFNLGSLFASMLAYFFICSISNNLLPHWSWRAIFVFAIFGTIVGLWIRISLPESIEFILKNSNTKVRKKREILISAIGVISNHPIRCISVITIGWLGVAQTSAIFIYSPLHMSLINNFSQSEALSLNTLSLLFLIPFIPMFGFISDYVSKIKLLIIASLSFLILSIPYFWFLSYGTYFQILLIKIIFCIPSACFYAVAPVLITETFPTTLRCTSLALIYQVTASLSAGLTPLIMLFIINHTNHLFYAPAYYLIISIFFCLIGLCLLNKEKTMHFAITAESN